jgi:hypothetical protein
MPIFLASALRHFNYSTVFLWLNIDQAINSTSFVYNQALTSFTVEPFNTYFCGLMVTLHSLQKIRLARQKIEDFFVETSHFEF